MTLLKDLSRTSVKKDEHYFDPLCRKGKAPDFYHKIRRGLGYVSTPISPDFESEKWVHHDHSLEASSWESDVSIGDIFKSLLVNMISASHLEDEDINEAEEMMQLDIDP